MSRILITTKCENCGKDFEHRKPGGEYQGRFCSVDCVNQDRSKRHTNTLYCIICGNVYQLREGDHQRKTCSQECKRIYSKQLARSDKRIDIASKNGKANKGSKRPQLQKEQTFKTCLCCGKRFHITNKSGSRDKERRQFCSQDCWYNHLRSNPQNHPGWRGGYEPYYGPNWNIQKRKARKRDKYTCQDCGITEAEYGMRLDVHHIKAFRLFTKERYSEANTLDNLISLCKSCHAKRRE